MSENNRLDRQIDREEIVQCIKKTTRLAMAYPGFARGGCPKNYVHAHNVDGRGPRT